MMSFTWWPVPFLWSGRAALRELTSPTWEMEKTTCLEKMAFVVLFLQRSGGYDERV
jgi:hypothetical protein